MGKGNGRAGSLRRAGSFIWFEMEQSISYKPDITIDLILDKRFYFRPPFQGGLIKRIK